MSIEYLFGFHAVTAFLKATPEQATCLFYAVERQDERVQKLVAFAKEQGVRLEKATNVVLERRASSLRHQGVVLQIEVAPEKMMTEAMLWSHLQQLSTPPFLLILDGIQDPHNLGACLRSANAAGVNAVILPRDRAARITPVVRKVAAGAVESTPVVTVTNLASTLKKLQEKGIWIYGLAGEAKKTLYEMELTGPIGLVLGAEGKGLRRLTKEHCDDLLAIPMYGTVESLNVSVATAVCLFETVRQRVMGF